MQRLVRFFMLICLRVSIVSTLVMWGIGSFATLGATLQRGATSLDIGLYREGIAVGYQDGDLGSSGVYMLGRATSWYWSDLKDVSGTYRSVPGLHFWSGLPGFARFGINYPAYLIIQVLLYALVHRWGRRRRVAKLQNRLQAAKQEYVEERS